MLKACCILTGNDFDLVKEDTPASKRKIELLGTCLLVPVTIWLFTSILLLNQVLLSPITTSILGGVVLAFVIFAVERAVIMSNGGKVIFAFRFCLALVVALLGAIALDEVVFKGDIDQQVRENERSSVRDHLFKVESDSKGRILRLQATMDSKFRFWQNANEEVNNEMKGRSGSSGMKGKGAIADENIREAELLRLDYEAAKSDLKAAEKSLATLEEDSRKDVESTWSQHSLLVRIELMFDLVWTNGWMGGVYVLFTLLLVFLELLVVIIKTFAEETNYERRIQLIEAIGASRMKAVGDKDRLLFDPAEAHPHLWTAKAVVGRPLSGVFR